MVTVGNYPDLVSAQLAKSFLDAEGVAALIPDEFLAGTAWQLGTTLQGVRLQVEAASEQRARQILQSSFSNRPEEQEDDVVVEGTSCPACGSAMVGPARWRKRLKVASLLLLFPLLLWPLFVLLGKRFACSTCGHEWG